MQTNEEDKFFFTFSSIRDLEFNMRDLGPLILKDSRLTFSSNIEQNFKARKEEKKISTRTEIVYQVDNPKNLDEKIDVVRYVNLTIVHCEHIDLLVTQITEDEVDIDEEFLAFMSSVIISTIRGILIEKLANSSLRAMILPLVFGEDLV